MASKKGRKTIELGEVKGKWKSSQKIFCFGCQGPFKTTNFKCTKYNASYISEYAKKKKL